jgi:hypothetical protein
MGIHSSIQRARSLSNCIKFAYDLWRLREAAYEGIEDGRYVCMRKSDWGNFPHVLYGQMCEDGKIRVVSYKPTSPKKRPFPPPLFKGAVKWGDRNRARPPLA